jgi:hypothetical protein
MRCISALVCTVLLLFPQTARSEHGPPTAASVDELVEALEELAADFGLPGEEAIFAGDLRFSTAGVCLLFPSL